MDDSLKPPWMPLAHAVKQLEIAMNDAYLWAGDIRQDAEKRLNIPCADERALEDPLYDQALEWCGKVAKLAQAASDLLAERNA